MKRIIAGISAVIVLCLFVVSCQKELSYEGPVITPISSAWEFKQDTIKYAGTFDTVNISKSSGVYVFAFASGPSTSLSETFEISIASPITNGSTFKSSTGLVNFTFLKNGFPFYNSVPLDTAIEFTVVVTAITDSTIVGTFSGKVEDASLNTVTLKEGKFSARTKPVVVLPTISAGTLATTSTDSCTGAVLAGTYKKNAALTTTNTVTVSVNVTTIGSYAIGTDTLKGIYFYKAGSFTATGVQSLVLQGVGTPTDSAAAARFKVKYGTSTCKFTVKIDTGAAVTIVPPTGDYLPLTTNSNWSYDVYDSALNSLDDTLYERVTGTFKTIGASSFNIVLDAPTGDSVFYRKGSGIYYGAFDLSNFLGTGGYKETVILKDNVPVGTTWQETVAGTPGLKLDYVITAKAVSVTLGAYTYPDVIKVRAVISVGTLGIYTVGEVADAWYARGVGLIYGKQSYQTVGGPTLEARLKRFTIF